MDWKQGVTRFTGLVLAPVLAPDMQLSLHPAQSKRFPDLGRIGAWGLATPGRITRRSEDVAMQLAAARYLQGRHRAAADRREQLPHVCANFDAVVWPACDNSVLSTTFI